MDYADVEANETRPRELSPIRRVTQEYGMIFRVQRDYPLSHPSPWVLIPIK